MASRMTSSIWMLLATAAAEYVNAVSPDKARYLIIASKRCDVYSTLLWAAIHRVHSLAYVFEMEGKTHVIGIP